MTEPAEGTVFTPNLNLAKQPTGAENWGEVLNENFDKIDEAANKSGGGLEIGDIGFAPLGIDETQNKRRYLNGQVISQTQFAIFADKVKAAIALYPNLATTETNWQAEVTNSKLGQCGKFVIDDTAGTIRLPKVVNINGLTDLSALGGIKAESLPNITGILPGTRDNLKETTQAPDDSALYWTSSLSTGNQGASGTTNAGLAINASRSSSTYQNNAPVQQEAVQYPYFIQVATGSEESVDVSTEIQLNNPFSLLDYKWSEYELTNSSWLISNGSFHSGATYAAVYELLLKIYNGTETKAGVSVKLTEQQLYCFSESGTTNPYLLSSETVKVGQTIYGYNSLQAKGVVTAVNTDSIVIKDETTNATLTLTRYQSGDKVGSIYTDYDYVINTADTTFRLPVKVKLASGNAVVGNGYGMALTTSESTDPASVEATHYFFESRNNSSLTGSALQPDDRNPVKTGTAQEDYGGFANNKIIGLSPNPSLSGIETSSSGLKLYFYVGETVQDANVINAAGVLTRVANCIDRTVASDRETVVGWGMPDYSAVISVIYPLSSNPYTAPCDGVLCPWGLPTNNGIKPIINGVKQDYLVLAELSNGSGGYQGRSIYLSKGDVIYFDTSYSKLNGCVFYPLKGVN